MILEIVKNDVSRYNLYISTVLVNTAKTFAIHIVFGGWLPR